MAIVISALFYSLYTKNDVISLPAEPDSNTLTKQQKAGSDNSITIITTSNSPETTSNNISTIDSNNQAEKKITTISKQTKITNKPILKQTKPKEIAAIKKTNEPIKKGNFTTTKKDNIRKPPRKTTKPVASIVTNKPKDKTPEENNNRKPLIVAKKSPVKTTVKTPIFELPQLNLNTKKVSLETNSDRQIPRGRTQTLRISTPQGITMDGYKIMKGLSEFNQVEIKKIKPISNNEIEIKLYAQSNAQMGDFFIIGIYQNKKTKPLILEVTL